MTDGAPETLTSDQNGSAPFGPANCWAALLLARTAIAEHREAIFGADYNYDADESYEPEAKLYRVLPVLDAVLKKARPTQRSGTPEPDSNH